MDLIFRHFIKGFDSALAGRNGDERRIGAELKFPLVKSDGTAVDFQTVCDLWSYLAERGWEPVTDALTQSTVGARKPGERNHTVASCETGFCKTEFSLAHVADLFELEKSIKALREELKPFAERSGVFFLGYGIQPVTKPSKKLLMKKTRTSVWDKVFGANRILSEEDGDDVNLFTINAASHVHVSVSKEEAVDAVNVLNGFSGAQIALTANSSIWKGMIDAEYKCVAEKFWDWWMPDRDRIGVPGRPFQNMDEYIGMVSGFRPVYVKRNGKPILLKEYKTFAEYYQAPRAVGIDDQGREISFIPARDDIDLHFTCFWHNARLSRYYTVENRVNDQQPPEDLACISALTLGLVSALPEAREELAMYEWGFLRASRELACRDWLNASVGPMAIKDICARMLDLAELGLKKRGMGEEKFLAPLWKRLNENVCPAIEAEELFAVGGIQALLNERSI